MNVRGEGTNMYAQELVQNYAAVRARLYGKPQRQLPPPEPEPDLQETVWPVPDEVDHTAPLDMLKLPNWRFLVALSALKHGQTFSAIIGFSRERKLVIARHEAVWLIAFHTPHSIARMGTFLNRDHTTLLHSLSKFPYIKRANRPGYDKDRPMTKVNIDALPKEATLLDIVRAGYEQAIPTADIAKAAGVTKHVIRNAASKAKIRHPNAQQYRPKSKLDWVVKEPK